MWMWEKETKINGTPALSFTIEGFDFNNEDFADLEGDVEGNEYVHGYTRSPHISSQCRLD